MSDYYVERAIRCVSFLAGVPDEWLDKVLSYDQKPTIVSLMLACMKTEDDTPLHMLSDELQSFLNPVTKGKYIDRRSLIHVLHFIYQGVGTRSIETAYPHGSYVWLSTDTLAELKDVLDVCRQTEPDSM